MSLLQVRDVVTAYGKIEALKGVSLEVAQGSITCLLGPNGAGKTTLMMTIAGILKPRRGRIVFQGGDIAGRAPHAIVAKGVALVPEIALQRVRNIRGLRIEDQDLRRKLGVVWRKDHYLSPAARALRDFLSQP